MGIHRIPIRIVLVWILIEIFTLSACGSSMKKQVEIIDHQGYFTPKSYSTYTESHIVSEIRNNGSTNLMYIEILVTFYGQDGNIQNSDHAYALVDILLPGEVSPFRIQQTTEENVSKYKIEIVNWRETDIQPYKDFQILDQTGEVDKLMDWYHIFGSYTNNGTSDANFTTVMATCYDKDGKVISVGWTGDTLVKPGEVKPFDIEVYPVFTTYKIVDCSVIISCENGKL